MPRSALVCWVEGWIWEILAKFDVYIIIMTYYYHHHVLYLFGLASSLFFSKQVGQLLPLVALEIQHPQFWRRFLSSKFCDLCALRRDFPNCLRAWQSQACCFGKQKAECVCVCVFVFWPVEIRSK